MLVSKEGVILSRRKRGEADAIISLLTKEGELLQVCIHGILATKKRNILTSEPGSLISATCYMKGENTVLSCKEASLKDRFSYIKESYESLSVTAYILDLVLAFSEGEKDPALFRLTLSALSRLNEILRTEPGRIKEKIFLKIYILFFKLRLLHTAGLAGFSELTSAVPDTLPPDELRRITGEDSEFLKEAAFRYRFSEFFEICRTFTVKEESADQSMAWCDQIISQYVPVPLKSEPELRRMLS